MLPMRPTRPSRAARPAPPDTKAGAHRRSLPRTRTVVGIAGVCAVTVVAGSAVMTGSGAIAYGAAGPAATDTRTVRSTVRPAVDPRLSTGQMLVQLPWGAEPGQVGLETPGQGLARGPEALAVAADGRIAILDSVNRRLVLLDERGAPTGSIPVSLASPRFLAVDDERLYVADAESDRRVCAWDWQGRPVGSRLLPPLDEPVTGVLLRGEQVLVETGHDQTYPLDLTSASGDGTSTTATTIAADTHGQSTAAAEATTAALAPSRIPTAPSPGKGRPLDRDGARTAEAERTPLGPVHVRLRDRSEPGTLTDLELALPEPIEHIVSLDGDEAGDVVIGVRLLRRGGAAPPAPLAVTRIPAGDRSGTQTVLLADTSIVYVGQPYTVAPNGRVYQPIATPTGYRIVVHELPRGVTR